MKKGLLLSSLILLTQFSSAQTFTNYSVADGLVNDNVSCVDAHTSSDIWFGTQLGVSQFDGSDWTTYETGTYPGMADDNILSIYIDDIDRPWIGTDFGTSFLDGGVWTTFDTEDGLGNNKVQCINQDLAGNMWFGTINGLSKFDGISWTNFGTGDGLPFGGVKSITLHDDGNLWIGTGLGGIAIYDGTDFTEITEDEGLISDKIRAIDFAPSGDTWVATAEGVSKLSETGSFLANYTTIFTLPDPDTLNPIVDIKVDGNGVVWAGVYVDYLVTEGGVCAYNGTTWFEYDESDGLAGPVVRAVDIAENNDVWVVTSTGVSKISDHTLSLNKNEKAGFSIYPNPTTSIVQINLPTNLYAQEVIIYDMQGQKIFASETKSGLLLNVTDWQSGIYLVAVDGMMQKLVVE